MPDPIDTREQPSLAPEEERLAALKEELREVILEKTRQLQLSRESDSTRNRVEEVEVPLQPSADLKRLEDELSALEALEKPLNRFFFDLQRKLSHDHLWAVTVQKGEEYPASETEKIQAEKERLEQFMSYIEEIVGRHGFQLFIRDPHSGGRGGEYVSEDLMLANHTPSEYEQHPREIRRYS